MKIYILQSLFILPFSFFIAACTQKAPDERDYVSRIASARAEKDRQFSASSESPVPPPRRGEFLPLGYFPIDVDSRVPAVLEPAAERIVIEMPTSTGKVRQMRVVGVLKFTYGNQQLRLTALTDADAGSRPRLFVPFVDLTSGAETYSGGRYMDLDPTATGLYEIDFNVAYHPFCYYDSRYDCPYPPPSNRLKVPVRAGERMKTQ
jgi:uncharacterized protein